MKKKRKYIYLEKCLIIRILQIYIFSFYDFLFFISLSDALSAIHLSNQRFLEYKKPYQQVCDLFCGALMAYFVEVSQVYCIRLFYIAPLFELIFFFFISVIGRLWGTTFMETSIFICLFIIYRWRPE